MRWGHNSQGFHSKMMKDLKLEVPRKRTPMMINPKMLYNDLAQQRTEHGEEFERVRQAFVRLALKGGASLDQMLENGDLSSSDFYQAFDVTEEEKEVRAEILAQLNPGMSKEEILDHVS